MTPDIGLYKKRIEYERAAFNASKWAQDFAIVGLRKARSGESYYSPGPDHVFCNVDGGTNKEVLVVRLANAAPVRHTEVFKGLCVTGTEHVVVFGVVAGDLLRCSDMSYFDPKDFAEPKLFHRTSHIFRLLAEYDLHVNHPGEYEIVRYGKPDDNECAYLIGPDGRGLIVQPVLTEEEARERLAQVDPDGMYEVTKFNPVRQGDLILTRSGMALTANSACKYPRLHIRKKALVGAALIGRLCKLWDDPKEQEDGRITAIVTGYVAENTRYPYRAGKFMFSYAKSVEIPCETLSK